MSEVVVKFDESIQGPDGAGYFAQAFAEERADGLWEGWLEFLPVDETRETIASARETTQPNRTNLEYWAQGLTRVYLEGALQRALLSASQPDSQRSYEPQIVQHPRSQRRPSPPSARRVVRRAILDPYSVYMQGEDVLRSELGALSRSHVESIADAYGFTPKDSPAELASIPQDRLIDTIIDGVRSAG
jgi:hypothetical protein